VWELTFFEASTPERLIAGIVAGLTLGIGAGDCACRLEGLAHMPVVFFGVVVVGMAGEGWWFIPLFRQLFHRR